MVFVIYLAVMSVKSEDKDSEPYEYFMTEWYDN